MSESSCYCTSSLAFAVICVPDFGHYKRCMVASHCCVNFHFSDDIWSGASFYVYLLSVYLGRFGEVFKVFGQIFNWVVCLLIVESKEFLIYFGYQFFTRYIFCKYFLPPSLWLVFSFSWQWLLESKILYFSLNPVCQSSVIHDAVSKNSLQTQGHLDLSPVSSSGSFTVLLCLVAQSCVWLFATPWTVCSPPGSSVHGDSPGKNAGVGCHALLQGIFPTQVSNPGLPHCRWILSPMIHFKFISMRAVRSVSRFISVCVWMSRCFCTFYWSIKFFISLPTFNERHLLVC